MKKILALALAAVVMLVSACGDSTGPATTGTLSGTVALGQGVQLNLSNARVAIYSSVADMYADRVVASTALTGNSPSWTYRMDNVNPGTYYLDVCLAVPGGLECVEYGNPSPITVIAGQTTNANITFTF